MRSALSNSASCFYSAIIPNSMYCPVKSSAAFCYITLAIAYGIEIQSTTCKLFGGCLRLYFELKRRLLLVERSIALSNHML
jgi:hypothetical protein